MTLIVADKFQLGLNIGSGSFGSIFAGTDIQTGSLYMCTSVKYQESNFNFTGEDVAIKIELKTAKHPQIFLESKVYAELQGGGIHNIIYRYMFQLYIQLDTNF